MIENISNIKYEPIASTNKKLKEVMVTYIREGKKYCYYIFVRIQAGLTDKDYLARAEKIFNEEISEREILKSSKKLKVIKVKADKTVKVTKPTKPSKGKSKRPLLIVLTTAFAIAAVGLGGYLIYQHFNTTPGGGGGYKPGQEVEVNPEINDPSGDYRVTFSNTKAVVGEEFNTTINLIPQNASTKAYYLPDKLVSVISDKTILTEEQYTYTLDSTTKASAALKVPAENVSGPIIVNFALVEGGDDPKPGEIVDVIAEVNDPSGAYKVTYNDKEKPERATVGQDYSTTLKLTKVGESDKDYTLPEKLSGVISGSSILKADKEFTYTLGETKMDATLSIPGMYVKGITHISLDLSAVEPEPVPVITGDSREPLTFVSNINSGEISIHYEKRDYDKQRVKERPNGINLEYQIDDGSWKLVEGLEQKIEKVGEARYDLTIVTGLKKGQAVRFRGDNDYWSYSGTSYQTCHEYMTFVAKGSFVIGNNIMSLLDKEAFKDNKDLTGKRGCFLYLFGSQKSNIVDASGLCLPATRLAPSAYEHMFDSCKDLVFSPVELPAENLIDRCYQSMFYNCSSLTKGPVQISSDKGALAEACCEDMFSGCTNLIEAPSLPSTTLAKTCYGYMFQNCSSLKIAPRLPANTEQLKKSDEWILCCYDYMFYNCLKLEYVEVGFSESEGLWPGYAEQEGEWEYLITNYWFAGAGTEATNKTFVWKGGTESLTFERNENTVPTDWAIKNPK